MSPTALHAHAPLAAEEQARADTYGLLAQLWQAAPDEWLWQRLQAASSAEAPAQAHAQAHATDAASTDVAPLHAPWQALLRAVHDTPRPQAAHEYDALFHGVGRPAIFLFASHHLSGFLNELPLARLRADLAALGLAGAAPGGQTEDHAAALFEVMRYLIAGGDARVCTLAAQQRFFRTHVQPWVGRLCREVQAHPQARVWRAVAMFTHAFVDVETQAFDMMEGDA